FSSGTRCTQLRHVLKADRHQPKSELCFGSLRLCTCALGWPWVYSLQGDGAAACAPWCGAAPRRNAKATTCDMKDTPMKTYYTVGLSLLTGIGVGAIAVQTLHAQAKPPVYRIAEIEITNMEAYTKEFAPKAQAALKAAGGRFLAAGQNVTALEGEPPKSRVTIQVWDSLEKMQAAYSSPE